MEKQEQEANNNIVILMVPFPAQSHLNQLLQLSSLITTTYHLPVHYLSSAVHCRQATLRSAATSPKISKIHFFPLPTPNFPSPPPDPTQKFLTQLIPCYHATLHLRQPFYSYLTKISSIFKRVVVIHDSMMSFVVQDVGLVPNAESYIFNAILAFSLATFVWERKGEVPKEFSSNGLPPFEGCVTEEIRKFVSLQKEHLGRRAGDLYNTCRCVESSYLDVLCKEGGGSRGSWAIGPILPVNVASLTRKIEALEWLDEQEGDFVLFVSFGTTVSMSDEDIEELAFELERSGVKFWWVLRDADKGNIFDGGEVRRGELPNGFEERVKGMGMVLRDWAPQLEILGHAAVGGFMSHCGWNSCIESIAMGVPIVAWPMHSDQPRNAMLVTDILKVGILLKELSEEVEVVKASTIESVVKRLMATEEGSEMRKRAKELAVVVGKATEEGGESRLELDSFIAHIHRQI